MRRLTLIALLVLMPLIILAAGQVTTLMGEVYDHHTGEPMPNVHVYIAGTSVGTTTDNDGFFALRFEAQRKTKITISAVGYVREHVTLQPGQSAAVNMPMREHTTQLQDVFVSPGDNPALDLMARVRAARHTNEQHASRDRQDEEVTLYISDLRASHLRQRLWRSLRTGMLEQADSSLLLPLYVSSRHSGTTQERSLIMTQTDYSALLADISEPINFYRNQVHVYSSAFLSPLASDGNAYYRYYLVDSTVVDTPAPAKHYRVDFRTRNPYYLTFNGTMLIDSATCALVAIEATAPRQTSANYLQSLAIRQTPDSESVTVLMNMGIKADTTHFFPSVLIRRTAMTARTDTLPAVLTPETQEALQAMNTADSLPLMRTARFFAYVIRNAYIPTGTPVEIGNIAEIINITPQEDVRLALPLRTAPSLWKNVCLEAYAAYGFGDRAWKGKGIVHWLLPAPRRHLLRLSYEDAYAWSDLSDFDYLRRENAVFSPHMDFTANLIKAAYRGSHVYNSQVRRREVRLQTENDWSDGVETRLHLAYGRLGYGEPTHHYASQPAFNYTLLGGVVRLSWNERKVDLYMHRHYVYNRLPVLYLGAEIGSYNGIAGRSGYDLFARFNIMLRHHVPLGVMGQLDYLVQAGVICGNVPYTLLDIFDGNQSYAYDTYRFTLMHHYSHAADAYAQLHAHWNGRGCLFNLIPGLRYLHLRELIETKIAVGGLRSAHDDVLPLPDAMHHGLTTYAEIGCGIGNIFRVADLMSVWRLTKDEPGVPRWSMRFRFHLDK